MARSKLNIEEQVQTVLENLPTEPTDYQQTVDNLTELGVTEPVRAITLLKQRKLVKLAVGRNEQGEKYFHINRIASSEGGQ